MAECKVIEAIRNYKACGIDKKELVEAEIACIEAIYNSEGID